MKRSHALLISLVLAFAVLAGSFAALRTTRLSTQSAAATPARVGAAQIARQSRALDRAEAALRAQLRRKPPALPTVAKARPAAPATAAAAVVYRRPPAIVHVIHRAGGEHEGGAEHDGGGGGDD